MRIVLVRIAGLENIALEASGSHYSIISEWWVQHAAVLRTHESVKLGPKCRIPNSSWFTAAVTRWCIREAVAD